MSKQRGFTLLELLVVVAIIAILAGVIVVNLNRARAEANDSKVQSEVKQISDGIQLYLTETPALAGNLAAAEGNLTASPATAAYTALNNNLVAGTSPILPRIPSHPGSGLEYRYVGTVTGGVLTYTVGGQLMAGADAGQCFQITNGSPSTLPAGATTVCS